MVLEGDIFHPDDPRTAPRVERRGEQVEGVWRAVWVQPCSSPPNAEGFYEARLFIEGTDEFDPDQPVFGTTSLQATECAFHALRRYCERTGSYFAKR